MSRPASAPLYSRNRHARERFPSSNGLRFQPESWILLRLTIFAALLSSEEREREREAAVAAAEERRQGDGHRVPSSLASASSSSWSSARCSYSHIYMGGHRSTYSHSHSMLFCILFSALDPRIVSAMTWLTIVNCSRQLFRL